MASTKSPDPADTTLQRRARRRLIGSIALVLVAVIALPMVFDEEKKPLDQDMSVQIPGQDVVTVRPPSSPGANPKVVEPREPGSGPVKAEDSPPKSESPTPPSTQTGPSAPASVSQSVPDAPKPQAQATHAPVAKTESKAETKSAAKVEAKVEPKVEQAVKVAKTESKAVPPAEEARVKAILENKPAPPVKDGSGFSVQIGAFASEEKIREAREKLGGAGYRSYTEKLETKDGERTRVRAGPFAARDAAEAARDKIRALGFASAAVVSQ